MDLLFNFIWTLIKNYLIVGFILSFLLVLSELFLKNQTTINLRDFIVLSLIWPTCIKYFVSNEE